MARNKIISNASNDEINDNNFLYDSDENNNNNGDIELVIKCEICGDLTSNEEEDCKVYWIVNEHSNNCKLSAHVVCLANYFLKDDVALIPKQSTCPRCDFPLVWVELIKNQKKSSFIIRSKDETDFLTKKISPLKTKLKRRKFHLERNKK